MIKIKNILLILFFLLAFAKPSIPATVYFSADFEEGDVTDITEGGGGGIFYEVSVSASENVAHSGTWSLRCYLADPGTAIDAKFLRWAIDQSEAYYSGWFYLDPGYDPAGWTNLMQWKTETDIEPIWVVQVQPIAAGVMQVSLHWWPCTQGHISCSCPPNCAGADVGKYYQDTPIEIPYSTWIHLEAYYKVGTSDGEIIVWQDGVEIFNLSSQNTQWSTDEINTNVMWGMGVYMDSTSDDGQLAYFDDIKVTDYQVYERAIIIISE